LTASHGQGIGRTFDGAIREIDHAVIGRKSAGFWGVVRLFLAGSKSQGQSRNEQDEGEVFHGI
jgi:hypothetical protein